ncbi:MAG: NAD(+) diphosphatase [Myxococcales bacterium]|nr:MAG: NAD(+) diphosphatase [Myxococcales bacterium]
MTDINFGGDTHERIAERRKDEEWLDAAWGEDTTRVLPIAGTRVHVVDGALGWTSPAEAPEGKRVLLGEDRFAVIADSSLAGEGWLPLRGLLPFLSADEASYVVHAIGLAEWHWATRHCPRCGGALRSTQEGHVLRCEDCGREQFPRTDPAVIMLIRDAEDRVLLGRQPAWPAGRWSTLAGFVEPGESAEQAVRREVLEESGVRVGEVTYFGSQPWPLPASLMLGYFGLATSTDIRVDEDEIEDARWFTRNEIRAGAEDGSLVLPGGVSISRSLIVDWYGEDLPGSW